MLSLRQFHVLHGGLQVRPRCQRKTAELLDRHRIFGEFVRPGDVELLDRRAVVEERQQLDLGGPQVDRGGLDIGFELNALQREPVQIQLRDVAGVETRAANPELTIPVSQILLRVVENGFGLQHLHKSVAQREDQTALLILVSGAGDVRRFLRAFEPQFPLVRRARADSSRSANSRCRPADAILPSMAQSGFRRR